MSESSYASTHEEIVPQPEKITQGTQVDFAPFHYQYEKGNGKLHRHHTSSELLIASQKNCVPYLRTSTLNRPKYRFDSNLTRPDSLNALPSRSDSGYGTYSTAKVRSKATYGDSPTLSLTPPNSQDYLYLKSEHASSVPSVLSNGMNSSKANGGLYLNPNYLQPYPSKYNQSSGELQVVIGGISGAASRIGSAPSGASSCHCSCRGVEVEGPSKAGNGGALNSGSAAAAAAAAAMTNRTTAEGLSWRRLHMSRAKLKATATTSELLSGFAMVAMVELQINEPTNVPEWLFVMFAVCTTVLVAVHIFALMISTYLLPTIDAVSKMGDGQYPEGSNHGLHVIRESPHERMRGFIELAWAFSTVLGLFLFLVEIAILCWVKFWDYSFAAATAATVIVIPVLIVFVAFAVHFYHSLVVHKCDTSEEDMEQLESMKRNLDTATINANSPV